MALFNVTKVNDYIKIAGATDFCVICAKKLCAKEKISAEAARIKLSNSLENKKAIFVRTSGVDQCICMDCVKEIHDEHIAPTLKGDN
jgi:hypothetical protein